ncbi:hypothetical protein GIB67_032856, partial [Kingdonia uniflora]
MVFFLFDLGFFLCNLGFKSQDIGVSSAPTFTGSGHEANKRAGQCSNIENANTSRKSSSQVDAHNGITGNKIPDQFVSGADIMDDIEDGDEARVTVGSEIQSESAQTVLEAQPTLGECRNRTDSKVNILGAGGNCERSAVVNCEGEGTANNEDGTDVSAWYLDLFAKDKMTNKWSWGSTVLVHMYHNLDTTSRDDGRQFKCCTTLLELNEHATLSPNGHNTMLTRGESGGLDKQITLLNDEFRKLKEDKDKESKASIKQSESLKEN